MWHYQGFHLIINVYFKQCNIYKVMREKEETDRHTSRERERDREGKLLKSNITGHLYRRTTVKQRNLFLGLLWACVFWGHSLPGPDSALPCLRLAPSTYHYTLTSWQFVECCNKYKCLLMFLTTSITITVNVFLKVSCESFMVVVLFFYFKSRSDFFLTHQNHIILNCVLKQPLQLM